MTEPEKQKKLFGTNGVRAVVGKEMTPELVMGIGMALGSMRKGKIAVGMDTRTSGPALCSALKAGLLACGCDVVDMGVLPTPALQYLVKNHFDAGAVITASHNPPEYNGVKVIEGDGTEMDDEQTIKLEERLFSKDFNLVDWENVGTKTSSPEMIGEYIHSITSAFPDSTETGFTVAVDPGSGPACLTTPDILTKLGCRVHTINGQTDGRFPGRLPEPSPEGLKALSELVISTGAAFGVAHDGDADRAVFVDENGDFLEENEEFALMQRFVCKGKTGTVVTPVSTSQLVEAIAAETGTRVEYTRVGSIYVARKMLELSENGENVLFGGEGNGGLIFPAHQHCRDGGMTAAVMVHILKNETKTLSELRKELPSHHMLKDKIFTTDAPALLKKVKTDFASDRLDTTDGVRINREKSWALFRPSGTEPFMRLYVEAENIEGAKLLYNEIMNTINN